MWQINSRPMPLKGIFFTLFALLWLSPVAALGETPDWQTALTERLTIGKPLSLASEQGPVFAIQTPSRKPKALGAIILLHGEGAHPDWPDVIHPLRLALADAGWQNLSVQLPTPEALPESASAEEKQQAKETLFNTSRQHIQAAMNEVAKSRPAAIVLVGHDLGAVMAADYIASVSPNRQPRNMQGLVLIAMPSSEDETAADYAPALLEKTNLAILDIFGQRDSVRVKQSAPARKLSAQKHPATPYRQVSLPGADHFFTAQDTELSNYIRGWLWRVVLGKEP